MIRYLKQAVRSLRWTFSIRTPYRFYVRRIQGIDDVDLVASVLGTDPFRGTLEPVPLSLGDVRTCLVLAPHQDDEAIGAGGTMSRLAGQGSAVHAVFLTDGRQDNLPGISEEQSVTIRRAEAEGALACIGAGMHELGINNRTMEILPAHIEKLTELLESLQPDTVILPWLFDGPVKHRLASHLLLLALRSSRHRPREVWGCQIHNEIFPNAYVDITDQMEMKIKMVGCYETQVNHIQAYGHLCRGMAAWNARHLKPKPGEVAERCLECFFTLPTAEFVRVLETLYLPRLEEVYKGQRHLIETLRRLES